MRKIILLMGLCIMFSFMGCTENEIDIFIIEDDYWGNITFLDKNISWYNYTFSLKNDFSCEIDKQKGFHGCNPVIGKEFVSIGDLVDKKIIASFSFPVKLSEEQAQELNRESCYFFYLSCMGKGNKTISKPDGLVENINYQKSYKIGECPCETKFININDSDIEICDC